MTIDNILQDKLNHKAVLLCEAVGVDKATNIENTFLSLVSAKYWNKCINNKYSTHEYTNMQNIRLEKYIGLYLAKLDSNYKIN